MHTIRAGSKRDTSVSVEESRYDVTAILRKMLPVKGEFSRLNKRADAFAPIHENKRSHSNSNNVPARG